MHYQPRFIQYGYYIGIILAVLLLTACGKDKDDPYLEAWKQQNEQAFNNLANNPDYMELHIPGSVGSIYVRVLQKGEGKRTYYNSRVEVYYKGWFVVTNDNYAIKADKVFDQRLFDDGVAFKVAISREVEGDSYASIIEGWSIALQYMVEGDKWEVWIPHLLAYGEKGKLGIPAYSTLAFEIELVKAIDPDEFM